MKSFSILAALVVAAVAHPLDSAPVGKRQSSNICQPQPVGPGPVPSPDTPSAFLSDSYFADESQSATTPSGYISTFTNLQASNNANGYMGFTLLQSYDTSACANQCNSIYGCQAFNIFFERDPTVNPNDPSCSNPPSTTYVKCVFWSGYVSAANADNTGFTEQEFQVVVAGSNGYVNQTISPPSKYSAPDYLGSSSINAVNDCNGNSGFVQSNTFQPGPFDITLCAQACTEQNNYVASQGGVQVCTYFDTYLLYKNGVNNGQQCVMYNQTWPDSYATNTGFTYGSDVYTIGLSYSSYLLSANNPPPFNC